MSFLVFQKFVEQNGGVRGGWDEYDHQTFLKFRQRYQVWSEQITGYPSSVIFPHFVV